MPAGACRRRQTGLTFKGQPAHGVLHALCPLRCFAWPYTSQLGRAVGPHPCSACACDRRLPSSSLSCLPLRGVGHDAHLLIVLVLFGFGNFGARTHLALARAHLRLKCNCRPPKCNCRPALRFTPLLPPLSFCSHRLRRWLRRRGRRRAASSCSASSCRDLARLHPRRRARSRSPLHHSFCTASAQQPPEAAAARPRGLLPRRLLPRRRRPRRRPRPALAVRTLAAGALARPASTDSCSARTWSSGWLCVRARTVAQFLRAAAPRAAAPRAACDVRANSAPS